MTDSSRLLAPAAAEFLRVAGGLTDLGARTPCAGYDVRALLNHLLYWGPWLIAAGRRSDPPVPGVTEADAGLVAEDWLAALEKQTGTLVDVFSAPAAWTGMTALGSASLPSAVVGEMVLGEFVLHGWDLAAASGQKLACPAETALAVHAAAEAMGAQARSMGVYGPLVPVPPDASPLDLALGASGRDPAWR
jgi:uncharacterized protein (TIGR03086 family)